MPDVYATITEAERTVQERLADVIEARFADPRHRAMLEAYLSEIAFPPRASVLEIGCGTGAVVRRLARWPGVARALGIDPSPVFIERARTLGHDMENVAFEVADGRALRFADGTFDVVIVHTTLSHVPQPERLVGEAFRVIRQGGWFAAFDGDYATATVSLGENDPLAACVNMFRANFVHDPWIVRRLPALLRYAGFEPQPMRSHGYVEAGEAGYLLSWIERGAAALAQDGRIGADAAQALRDEARRRSAARAWFGHIAFASVVARKPGRAASCRDAGASAVPSS